uniref:Uncharacterized protein n=1 Tax=viral metagenome TaxID=1070528 RepID=A0A6M3ITK1_9ZZZZ
MFKKMLFVFVSILLLTSVFVFGLKAAAVWEQPHLGNVRFPGHVSIGKNLILNKVDALAASESLSIADGTFFFVTGGLSTVIRTFGCDSNYNYEGRIIFIITNENTIFEDGAPSGKNIHTGGCNYNAGAGKLSIWIYDGCVWRPHRSIGTDF